MSGCIRCKCSCARRRGPPCAAAKPSGSGSVCHRADRRWPCRILQSKNTMVSSAGPASPALPVCRSRVHAGASGSRASAVAPDDWLSTQFSCSAATILEVLAGLQLQPRQKDKDLQSKLVSTEHFTPAEIKSARLHGALAHEITERQQTQRQPTHSDTRFFNYQAGENSGGRPECLQLRFYFISQ